MKLIFSVLRPKIWLSKIKEYQQNEEVAYIDGGKTTKYKTKHRQYKKTKRKRVKTRKLIKTTIYKRV